MHRPTVNFYSEPKYRQRQAFITKRNWKLGIYSFKIKPQILRSCKNPSCLNSFLVKPYNPKIYCSHRCSASVGNLGRVHSIRTKMMISKSIHLLPKSKRGHPPKKELINLVCQKCHRNFKVLPYLAQRQKYCSVYCNMAVVGRKTTSPKASKGKNGIRVDIDPNINFYSTWEANMARVFSLVGLRWIFAPKIFDIGKHTYRPDFYLPDFDMFVEVKNFMGDYSLLRDQLFRKRYPNIKLELILKNDYENIRFYYKELIDNWET